MKHTFTLLFVALGLASLVSEARGQNFGNIPPGTVIGNPPSASGPAPAHPIAVSGISYDISFFGGVGDWNGSTGTDNTTALQNACNYVSTHGGVITFGNGSYRLTGQVTCNMTGSNKHIGFQGQGRDLSTLVWTNPSGGIVVNYATQFDSVDVSDITFATNAAGGGTALTLTVQSGPPTIKGPISQIQNSTFRGADGYSVADFWTTAVRVNGVSNINFIGNNFTSLGAAGNGTGVDLQGTAALNGAVYNFIANQFVCQAVGINYGTYIQGVVVSGGNNFTCGGTGILVPSGGTALDQLTVTGNQFEMTYGIRDQTGVNATVIGQNIFITDKANSFGLSLEANSSRSIVGNECQAGSATSTCMQLLAGAGIIDSNNFVFQNKGIVLGASTSSVYVSGSNEFLSTTTSITDNSGGNNNINGDFAWTPTLIGLSTPGTPTYSVQNGLYHRDGKKTWAAFMINVTALGGMVGALEITGFPGKNSSIRGICSLAIHTGLSGNPQGAGFIEFNANPVVAQLVDPSTGGPLNTYTAPLTLQGECDYVNQ